MYHRLLTTTASCSHASAQLPTVVTAPFRPSIAGAWGVDCAEGEGAASHPAPRGVSIYVYELPDAFAMVPFALRVSVLGGNNARSRTLTRAHTHARTQQTQRAFTFSRKRTLPALIRTHETD
eukprot:3761157-Pleurochrysis_carterae.AAC.2